MKDEQLIQELFSKYLEDTIAADERERLRILLDTAAGNEVVSDMLRDLFSFQTQDQYNIPATDARIKRRVHEHIRQQQGRSSTHRIHLLKTTWFRYAAAIFFVVVGAAVWYTLLYRENNSNHTIVVDNKYLQTDIAPGRDRAILTLANGQQIILDSARGNIVKQGGLTVVNLAGKLKYEGVGTVAEYNTISTPKGGQYQVVLPDGSKVWLNAVSSVKFPTAFTRNVRHIEMTGEAYIEVARDSKQPFIVKANGAEIQVLGTSFNVNAYEDENNIKTTLIEGSVKVMVINSKLNDPSPSTASAGSPSVLLKPGQQAVMSSNQLKQKGQAITVGSADLEQALAWKNGVFRFNQANLADAMRQLARWYEIEVVYEKGVPDIKLEGGIKRDLTLSEMLDALSKLGVKFRMEGRQLVIMKF